jgi:hypothetical protein
VSDKRRFSLFAAHLKEAFPSARRVYDVAGGMGALNAALGELGIAALTFDARRKRLPVAFAERRFTLEEPCACDLIVGLHPDGATRLIIEYAAKHRIPFSVVPCCSDNGTPYKTWMKQLAEAAAAAGFAVSESRLEMEGRARVLTGAPNLGKMGA